MRTPSVRKKARTVTIISARASPDPAVRQAGSASWRCSSRQGLQELAGATARLVVESEQRLERVGSTRCGRKGFDGAAIDRVNPIEGNSSGEKRRDRLLVGGVEDGRRSRRRTQRVPGEAETGIEAQVGRLEGERRQRAPVERVGAGGDPVG